MPSLARSILSRPPVVLAASRSRRTRRPGLVGAGIAALLVLTGCSGDEAASEEPAAAGGAHSHDDDTHPHGEDLALAHVHGLGVDQTDGALYAGTHYGLLRISPDGELSRVADRIQDFMGFTVVAPGHYLASGHPGEGQSGPSNLGLIESTDGGQTWTTLSLAGDADFHALDAARGRIYGYSGGKLLLSEDGVEWADRGQMNIADLAVDPYVSSRVLVTTEKGVTLSEDAGETFEVVPESPLLLLVDFSLSAGEAVGISPKGVVYASTDRGQTWMERGDVGAPPEALSVDGEDVYVAVEGAILVSTDGGATFTELYREQ